MAVATATAALKECTALLSHKENNIMTDIEELHRIYSSENSKENFDLANKMAIDTFYSFYSKSIQMIAAGISHELKSPLQSMTASLEIIEDMIKNNDFDLSVLCQCVEICKETRLMMTNVIDVMALCGKEINETDISALDIDKTINKILESVRYREEYKSHKISLNYSSKLDDYDENVQFYTLPSFIYHVITNIIINSCNAISSRGDHVKDPGKIQIRCSYDSVFNEICIEIEDNGIGIHEENFDKIFMPFYSHRLVKNSHGLGLFIARSMLSKINGSIYVKESKPGKTIFCVLIKNLSEKNSEKGTYYRR